MLLEAEKTRQLRTRTNTELKEPACRVIGVLDNAAAGLSGMALRHIRDADVIIGATKMLQLYRAEFKHGSEQKDLTGQLMRVPDWIRHAQEHNQQCVVLASGDPLCHGIGGFLQSRLCIEGCEIIPNVSTIQLACARVGLAWQDIKICSIHSGDCGEWQADSDARHGMYPLLRALQSYERLAVLTSPHNTPDRIARMMIACGFADEFHMAVVERICSSEEKVRGHYSIRDAAQQSFADPNVVLLWRTQARQESVMFGLTDESYKQRKPEKGLITKREIRAVSLARLQLRRNSVVWDIGAGSGSVGLEAARVAQDGYVYAIEKNVDDVQIALANQVDMGVRNYRVQLGKAPAYLDDWPDPDAVFIGGSGGELAHLITLCFQRLRSNGVLVMNFVTLENLHTAMDTIKQLESEHGDGEHMPDWDMCQMQVSRSKPILGMQRLAAENPVWIISLQKTKASIVAGKPIQESKA